ncbi:MAG: outer membrane lipoprotein carrier protein LolA [wastewater metagenome]|nr:outer membrane lipoprotein carrier protein LolA [Candidatus Loosdrechtia aerotolerans]
MEEIMYKNTFILFLCFVVNVSLFQTPVFSKGTSGQKDRDEVLNEMEKANSNFKTLTADITFTRTISLLESTDTSKGTLRYKKPKMLYLKFYPPRNEINIIDGKYLWVYRPDERQVEKYHIGGGQSGKDVNFLAFGYEESVMAAKKNYKITLLGTRKEGKQRFYILGLSPKDPESQYSDIRLWVEEGFWLPGKIELYESGGEVVNIIEFNNIKLNKSISNKIFLFEAPRGVEVIEPFK